MELFIESLAHVPDGRFRDSSDPELNDFLNILERRYPRLWDDLWDIKTPFLDSENVCTGKSETSESPLTTSFHEILCTFCLRVYSVLLARRCAEFSTTQSQHALITPLQRSRLCGSKISHPSSYAARINQQLQPRHTDTICKLYNDHHWDRSVALVRSVSLRCRKLESTSREKITAAWLRDLKDERALNQDLYSVVISLYLLRPFEEEQPLRLETPLEMQLLPYSLAAARRSQLCLGDTTYVLHGDIIFTIYNFLM